MADMTREELIEKIAEAIGVSDPEVEWDYVRSIPNHPIYRLAIKQAEAALSAMEEAGQSLDELASALRQLMAQTEWRRSDQELPRDGRVVIVHGGIAYRRDGRWYTITGKEWPGEVIQWPVDVWLHLPEPPANGEEK